VKRDVFAPADTSPQAQLARFIDRYSPEISTLVRAALKKMRARLPGATELVYDNYNGLVIGFGPSDRSSDAIFSLAVYPRWANLFFLDGAQLEDPEGILKGSGSRVRRILLDSAATLDDPAVRALMTRALAAADKRISRGAQRQTIIKSVSKRQRPRRPPTRREHVR
jgi:hypothetical protein